MDNAGNITSSDVLVFSHGGITGTVSDGASVTGQTSGCTGTVIHATSTQILVDAIASGPCTTEELRVSVGNSVTTTNAGDSPILVAEVYNDDGNLGSFEVDGLTTSSTNYAIITGRQEKHGGTYSNGPLITRSSDFGVTARISDDNYVLEWVSANNTNATTNHTIEVVASTVTLRNNFIKATNNGNAIVDDTTSINYYYRNIIYPNGTGGGISIGSFGASKAVVYNNTLYNGASGTGIRVTSGSSTAVLKNNLVLGFSTDCNISSGTTSNNAGSSTGCDIDSLVAADELVNPGTDFHLKTGATAIDAGVDLGSPYNTDIDNTTVTGTWDIGADEYVATGGTRRVMFIN